MSTSPARLAANAANAQHSTGPRTAEGKARSAQNARSHGLTARELVIAPDEREEFEELLAGYQAEVQPSGAIQQSLFDALVAAAWNLRRARRAEAELCANTTSYHDLLANEEIQASLDRLARHQSRIERTFHRSLKELKALQTNAVIEATLPPSVRRCLPPLTCATAIAKRTQHFEQQHQKHLLKVRLEALAPPDSVCAPSPQPM